MMEEKKGGGLRVCVSGLQHCGLNRVRPAQLASAACGCYGFRPPWPADTRCCAKWAAAGFMDTLLRCEDETGGGLCGQDGNSVVSSRLRR